MLIVSLASESMNPKKHFVFMSRSTAFGGIETRLLDWLSRVDYSKAKVTILNPLDVFSSRYEKSLMPFEVLKPDIDFKFTLLNLLKWINLFKRLSPDTIIFSQGDFFCFPCFLIFLGYIFTKGNIVLSEHSAAPELPKKISRMHFKVIPGIGLWKHKLAIRGHFAKKVLAVSNGVKERLIDWGYPEEKIKIIKHGVDANLFYPSDEEKHRFRKLYSIPANETVLVSTARLERVKRLDRLVNAFNILCKEHNQLWLIFVGEGSLKKELENSVEFKNKVFFLGFLEKKALADVLRGCDIYVLPSENEGFGIALIEAMSSGLLCVATKVPGPSQIIEDDMNGFLSENTDNGVLETLKRVLDLDFQHKELIAKNARRTVLEKYGQEDAIRNVLNLLQVPFKT